MTTRLEQLFQLVESAFPQGKVSLENKIVVLTSSDWDWITTAQTLRDDEKFLFSQLLDLTVVDYLGYGQSEWNVSSVSETGFGRAGEFDHPHEEPSSRFSVVVHLLSVELNQRIRLKVALPNNGTPALPSLIEIWRNVDWYEREAFDLFGVHFEGHPRLSRILTDYDFEGHPFRKDYPTEGHLEMVYDEEKQEVVYRPVSIKVSPNVPRVIRHQPGGGRG